MHFCALLGVLAGVCGKAMRFPYQIWGYFESRGAKNLVFGAKTRFLMLRRVRDALLGVLKVSKIESIFEHKIGVDFVFA